MKIISIYNEILENPNADIQPQTFIFGCKAAPGYAMAKKLIKLIWFLSEELERNPLTKDKIKVVFMEEYNVSLAEILIPSADISEQISLAGKEASGTGCMKLMINGAITIGTLDGANVEMLAAVGDENMYIFGLKADEVEKLWLQGYRSADFYAGNERLRRIITFLTIGFAGESFADVATYLLSGHGVADPYMCLADFESYRKTHDEMVKAYSEREKWTRMSLLNTAAAGYFAADRSIDEYAQKFWNLKPVH
jgi:starch phosphorylase